MTNRAAILRHLRELVELTILDEGSPQAFRVRAYEKAVLAIEAHPGELLDLSESALIGISGIGKSTAAKIFELSETGHIAKLDSLRLKFPPEFVAITRISGIGPKTAKRLRDELGIDTVDKLAEALDSQQIRELSGFGATSEERLKRALDRLDLNNDRTPIAEAHPLAESIVADLESLDAVERARYCGSLRRLCETIGDIDIVVASFDSGAVMDYVRQSSWGDEVLLSGETKTSVITHKGLQIDVRVVEPEQYGAASQYFTGSKAHNVALRQRALDRGWTLNEYGLVESATGRVVASATEEETYGALDLPWIPPPLRENTGEFDGDFDHLIQRAAMKGDLHVHTDRSGDGRSPIEAMLAGAVANGYEYLAITDHAENLTINGLSREQMLEQRATLPALAEKFNLHILHGAELNIGPDGTVDYDAEFLSNFDWCVASVHDHFDGGDQTLRLITAMGNPAVSAIGHLSGRMIGRRPGIEFDAEAVMREAAETGTAIEINGALERLDASTDAIRVGMDLGVKFVISTDAHHPSDYKRMLSGVLYAQRARLSSADILNTRPFADFLEWIKPNQ